MLLAVRVQTLRARRCRLRRARDNCPQCQEWERERETLSEQTTKNLLHNDLVHIMCWVSTFIVEKPNGKNHGSPQTPKQLHYEWIYKVFFPDVQGLLQHSDLARTECSGSSSMQTNDNNSRQRESWRMPSMFSNSHHYSILYSTHITTTTVQLQSHYT